MVSLGCLASLAACASSPPLATNSDVVVTSLATLPLPDGIDPNSTERAYRIGALDELSVNVFNSPELSVETVVADAGGRISLPLIGEVDARGRTSTELARQIEVILQRRYVIDPRVAVNVITPVSQAVTVSGSVREPGTYPIVGRTTLLRTIAIAKGTTEFARESAVVVFRDAGNTRYAALYNLKAIAAGQAEDPEVFANDVVLVGNSQARRFFRDILQVVPSIAVLGSAALR